MNLKFKYVFIGAGVSTVFTVMKMLDNGIQGKDILLIDKGKNPYNRQSNEVMCGFFGAGCFSDGKIIYGLDQGGELVKYTGEDKANKLIKELKYYIRLFHPNPEIIKSTGLADIPEFIKESNLELKQNECEHIGTDYLRQIGKSIYDYFIINGVNMRFEMEVIDIIQKIDAVYVKYNVKNNNYDTPIFTSFRYNKLIIATGKSGMDFLNRLINEYNLSNKPKAVQVGVRFESDYKYFKKLAKIFYDFKLIEKNNNSILCRTFCVNNKAAYISVEDNNGMKSFNGHGYKDESKNNGLTNFGIILEVKGINNPLEYTKELVSKCQFGGKGMYYTPDCSEREPTVEAQRCSLTDVYDIYGDLAYDIIHFIRELDKVFEFGNNYIIYLPEIKYLTNEVEVNYSDLSLVGYSNIHIIGDALSSRGIFCSATQGLYIADSFIKKNNL